MKGKRRLHPRQGALRYTLWSSVYRASYSVERGPVGFGPWHEVMRRVREPIEATLNNRGGIRDMINQKINEDGI